MENNEIFEIGDIVKSKISGRFSTIIDIKETEIKTKFNDHSTGWYPKDSLTIHKKRNKKYKKEIMIMSGDGDCSECILRSMSIDCSDILLFMTGNCNCQGTVKYIKKWIPCTKDNVEIGNEIRLVRFPHKIFKIIGLGESAMFVSDTKTKTEFAKLYDSFEILNKG